MYLQEARFGLNGIREIYKWCETNRRALCKMLIRHGISIQIPPASLDIIVRPQSLPELSLRQKWDLVPLEGGAILITVQPSVTMRHLESLVELFSASAVREEPLLQKSPVGPLKYPLPFAELEHLVQRVAGWHTLARSSGGYPLNQAPYSALGPIIGHFLPVAMDPNWVALRASKILKDRKNAFGLSLAEHNAFAATCTTGSTMGNRLGLHNALAQHSRAFVYFSTASHYSIKKTVLDSDE